MPATLDRRSGGASGLATVIGLLVSVTLVSTTFAATVRTPRTGETIALAPARTAGACVPLQEDDGSYENAYALNFTDVAAPDVGAFAKYFHSPFPDAAVSLCSVSLQFTALASFPQDDATFDVRIYSHDGSGPGDLLTVRYGIDPGPIALWPAITTVTVDFFGVEIPTDEFWVAFWGDWPGAELEWFLAADQNGAFPPVLDHVNDSALGWIPVESHPEFPSCRNVGIRCEVEPPTGRAPLPVIGDEVAIDLGCGAYSNPGPDPLLVCTTTVTATDPETPWVRVHFDQLDIGAYDYLVISDQLGESYRIEGREAPLWPTEYYSLAVDGPEATVELWAVPGSSGGGIHLDFYDAGRSDSHVDRSICGSDDRGVATSKPTGRMRIKDKNGVTYVGTAFLISENGCYLSAGHNFDDVDLTDPGNIVMEHNTPASTAGGSPKPAKAEDQYKLDPSVPPCWKSNGEGDDYAVFKVKPNEKTKKTPGTAQGLYYPLKSAAPDSGSSAKVVGYGKDDGASSFTQQEHTGMVTGVTGTRINHNADTRVGNSGSPILNSNGGVVGIHTNGGCKPDGTGSNSGTVITAPDLQACINQVCPKDDVLPPLGDDLITITCTGDLTVPDLGISQSVTLTGSMVMHRESPISIGGLGTVDFTISGFQASGLTAMGPVELTSPAFSVPSGEASQIDPLVFVPLSYLCELPLALRLPTPWAPFPAPFPILLSGEFTSFPIWDSADLIAPPDPIPFVDEDEIVRATLSNLVIDPAPPTFCHTVDAATLELVTNPLPPTSLVMETPGGLGIRPHPEEWSTGTSRWIAPFDVSGVDLLFSSDPAYQEVKVAVGPSGTSFGELVQSLYRTYPSDALESVELRVEVQSLGSTFETVAPLPVVSSGTGVSGLPFLPGDSFQSLGGTGLVQLPAPDGVGRIDGSAARDRGIDGSITSLAFTVGDVFPWQPLPDPGVSQYCVSVEVHMNLDAFGPLSFESRGYFDVQRGPVEPLPGGLIQVEIVALRLESIDPFHPEGPIQFHLDPVAPPANGTAMQSARPAPFPMDADLFPWPRIIIPGLGLDLHTQDAPLLESTWPALPSYAPWTLAGPVGLYDERDLLVGTIESIILQPWLPYEPVGGGRHAKGPGTPDCFALDPLGTDEPVLPGDIPQVALRALTPNPFRGATVLTFDVTEDGPVTLRVYDVGGRRVRTLVDADLRGPVRRTVAWDGTDDRGHEVDSGVYFFRLDAGGETRSRKGLLLR